MNKQAREQRRQEYLQSVQREITFQLSRFRYDASVFYLKTGLSTKTWFTVENSSDTSDITHISQIHVKDLDSFITAGIALSLKEKITVSELSPIIRQSLYVPLTLDMMLKMITAQSRFTAAKWHTIYPGVLFLGSKLKVTKVTGQKGLSPSVKHEIGQIYYPVMRFREYVKTKQDSYRGLWLPEIVREDHCNHNFSAAVSIET
jgi:hypothetical protein